MAQTQNQDYLCSQPLVPSEVVHMYSKHLRRVLVEGSVLCAVPGSRSSEHTPAHNGHAVHLSWLLVTCVARETWSTGQGSVGSVPMEHTWGS